MKEINGTFTATGKPVASFSELKADGSTACGAWIYSGVYAPTAKEPDGHNYAANRGPVRDWVGLNWGFAWPANRRVMYNRASADPAGNPWPKEARLARQFGHGERGYVYWDDKAKRHGTGLDIPDFPVKKPPDAKPNPKGKGLDFQDGKSPFIMKADGKGWLFAPSGAVDGPLPTHYEPYESPVVNPVYPNQQSNPLAKVWKIAGNPYAEVASPDYPCVLSTYRLTEHHLSGSMSRWLPWLSALQPELFVEISPEHASEIGAANLDTSRDRHASRQDPRQGPRDPAHSPVHDRRQGRPPRRHAVALGV